MKKNIRWLLVATLTCGLMLTACVDNIDNPASDPIVPPTNPVEESAFSKLMEIGRAHV